MRTETMLGAATWWGLVSRITKDIIARDSAGLCLRINAIVEGVSI
jgi:hypothetical protein